MVQVVPLFSTEH